MSSLRQGITPTRYDFQDFLASGWYNIETDGVRKWVWSKKTAILRFPRKNTGFSLYFYGGERKNRVSVYDLDRGFLGQYSIDSLVKQIDVLPPTNAIKIEVERLWKPKIRHKRWLGVALQGVSPLQMYYEQSGPPSEFAIEITTLCNMNPPCIMCDKSIPCKIPVVSHISESILDKLKIFLKHSSLVSLTGSGEPLRCRKLFNIIDSVDSKATDIIFNSNGLLLTAIMAEKLISKKLAKIDFSIDAATPETYGKIRKRGGFTKVKNNIKRLARIKKRKKIYYPKIAISMVLMKENIKELPAFINLARELDAQFVYVKLLKPIKESFVVTKGKFKFDYHQQMLDINSGEFRDNIFLAKEKAVDLGIEFKSLESSVQRLLEPNISEAPKGSFAIGPVCRKPWIEALIGINGDVRFCCHMQTKDDAQGVILGNLNAQSFEEIWNNSLAKKMRRQFINRIFPAECWACPYNDNHKR